MAFNWKTFQTRTVTAVIFAAVMLTGLLWNQWSFLILFSIIHVGCWWEYLRLNERIYQARIDNVIKVLFIFSGFILMIMLYSGNVTIDDWIGVAGRGINLKWLLWICTFIVLTVFLFQNKQMPARAKWMCLGGLAYVSVSIGLMLNLYGRVTIHLHDTMYVFGPNNIPLMIIISIWINDTMAYIVGSLIGKTPLSKVSPKKTLEGTIGGIVLSVAIIGLVAFFIIKLGIMSVFIMILAAVASIAGTFGDLFESRLKRMAGVKDSGNIMPGHGGFLDRFDSLLLATPAVWLYVYFLMR